MLTSSTETSEVGGYTIDSFLPSDDEEEEQANPQVIENLRRTHSSPGANPMPWLDKRSMLSKDWNSEYQDALEMDMSTEKFRRIRDCARDFEYAASVYSRIIVAEVCVPDAQKSIRPVDIGGSAGGKKFICNGILFKFALDSELTPGMWMYGGTERDDELAMKAGCHELKGLISYMAGAPEGLCFPLMALIDYKGYRLIATSLLPVDDSTIKYGSNDGGRTILCEDAELEQLMSRAARSMGLGPLTLADGRQIFGPSDIEGHRGKDGRYYVLDYARTFPAEYMSRKSSLFHPRSIFFYLLRPEFVRSQPSPLCSDVFSGFMANAAPDVARNLNKVTYAACKTLHQTIIPTFARALIRKFEVRNQSHLGSIEAIENVLEDLRWIVQETHRRGINLRYLGRLRMLVPESGNIYLRLILLTEMASRTLKSQLRKGHRAAMEILTFPSDAPFRRVAMNLFNTVIGSEEPLGEAKSDFWTLLGTDMCIKTLLLQKYGSGLSKTEIAPGFDLRSNVSLRLLLLRLQETTYLRFSARATRDLTEDPHTFRFTDSDIEAMQPVVKSLHLVNWAEANIAYMRAIEKDLQYTNESLRLLSSAQYHLELALNKATTNVTIMQLLVRTLWHLATTSFIQDLELEVQGDESESILEEAAPPLPRDTVRRRRQSTSNLTIPGSSVGLQYLRKAVAMLDRMGGNSLSSDDPANQEVEVRIHKLAGDIMAETGHQLRHSDRKSGVHFQWFQKAVAKYAAAFKHHRHLFYDKLVQQCRIELEEVNHRNPHVALHHLTLMRLQCTAMIEVMEHDDLDMLLLLGEIEVSLSQRVQSKRECYGLRDAAHSHFFNVLQADEKVICEYYKRKRNVLFSVANWKPNSALAQMLELLSPSPLKMSRDTGYPTEPADYQLIRPIKDKEGYVDSSGVLWEATCIPFEERVAIKICDNTIWKRVAGKMSANIIKKRQRVSSEGVVKFLAVFEDKIGSTWFIMPKYEMSAYSLMKKYPGMKSSVMLSILKLGIEALVDLHSLGLPHCKMTLRNLLLVAPSYGHETWGIKLTNKAAQQINTLIFRNVTNPHATFSQSRLRRALNDYDLSPTDAALFTSGESAEEDSEVSSSSDTLGSGTMLGLSEFLRHEQQQHEAPAATEFSRIAKSEDIYALLKIIETMYAFTKKNHEAKLEKLAADGTFRGMSDFARWDDVAPFLNISKEARAKNLPSLQALLNTQLFLCLEAEKELSVFMNTKRMAMNVSGDAVGSGTPTVGKKSKSKQGSNEAIEACDDEDAFCGACPVELTFGSGTKRDKLYNRIEDAARRMMGVSSRKSSGRSWGSGSPPRGTKGKGASSLSQLVYNVCRVSPPRPIRAKGRSITNIFSSSPPSVRSVGGLSSAQEEAQPEFSMDWVVSFSVFIYNKTYLMWQSMSPGCTCPRMEASTGSWQWRSSSTGRVLEVAASKYVGLVLYSLYDVIYRHNLLNSHVGLDLGSSATVFAELRDVFRRLARVFYHISQFHRNTPQDAEELEEATAAEEDAQEAASPGKDAITSPKSPRKERLFGSRRLSRDSKRRQARDSERALLTPSMLWDVFYSFVSVFKVDLDEKNYMPSPLFSPQDSGTGEE